MGALRISNIKIVTGHKKSVIDILLEMEKVQ